MLYPGAVIDHTYQIISELGKGGTAVVYMAYHLRLQKYVVLKNTVIEMQDMAVLRNEVDTLKNLRHTSLPQVYDFLQLEDGIFTVMDYVDGEDLEKAVQAGTEFSEQQLLQFMIEISEVLDYMHGHNPPLLHNDLKPGNVMLRPDGRVTLIDFNISMWLNGDLLGFTGNYASPEQYRIGRLAMVGAPADVVLDGRSDIFSLGATMYFLLTGIPPETSPDRIIPLSILRPDVSPDFLRVIERCMAWDREDRWQSAADLLRALNRLRHLGRDFRRNCLLQAAGLLVAGALVVSGVLCMAKGLQKRDSEAFILQYNTVLGEGYSVSPEVQRDDVLRLLNENSTMLETNVEYRYNLLLVAANCSMELAENSSDAHNRREYLIQAADWMLQAAQVAWENGLAARRSVSVSAVEILLELEDSAGIGKLMRYSKADRDLNEILTAAQLAVQGSASQAQELLATRHAQADPDLEWCCCSVQAGIAEKLGDHAASVRYYRAALQARSNDTNTLRKLGQLLMKLAGAATDENLRRQNYAEAADCFALLRQSGEAVLTDRVNYAASSRASGNVDAALEELELLQAYYPNNFQVLLQLALAQDMKRLPQAKSTARAALALLSESDLSKMAGDEGIRALRQIAGE